MLVEVYKIVDTQEEVWRSLIAANPKFPSQYTVFYKLGEASYPIIGSLFAYARLSTAISMTKKTDAILLCEAKKSEVQITECLSGPQIDKVEEFWSGTAFNYDSLMYIFEETVLVDWIRPLKVIHYDRL